MEALEDVGQEWCERSVKRHLSILKAEARVDHDPFARPSGYLLIDGTRRTADEVPNA